MIRAVRRTVALRKFRGHWNPIKRVQEFPYVIEPFMQKSMTMADHVGYADPEEDALPSTRVTCDIAAPIAPSVALSHLSARERQMFYDIDALPPPSPVPLILSDLNSHRQLAMALGIKPRALLHWANQRYNRWCPRDHPLSMHLPYAVALAAVVRFGRGRAATYTSYDPYLLDTDAERLTQLTKRPPAVTFIGPSGCGKSAICDVLRGASAVRNPRFGSERWRSSQSTEAWLTNVDAVRKVAVVDTPGSPIFQPQREAAITAADIVVLCVPVVRPKGTVAPSAARAVAASYASADGTQPPPPTAEQLEKDAAIAAWGDGVLATAMEQCALYRKPTVVMLCDVAADDDGPGAPPAPPSEPASAQRTPTPTPRGGKRSKRSSNAGSAPKVPNDASAVAAVAAVAPADPSVARLMDGVAAALASTYGPPPSADDTDATTREAFFGLDRLRALAATPHGAATMAQLAASGLDPVRHRVVVVPTAAAAKTLLRRAAAAAEDGADAFGPFAPSSPADEAAAAEVAAAVRVLKRQLLWAVDDEVARLRASEGGTAAQHEGGHAGTADAQLALTPGAKAAGGASDADPEANAGRPEARTSGPTAAPARAAAPSAGPPTPARRIHVSGRVPFKDMARAPPMQLMVAPQMAHVGTLSFEPADVADVALPTRTEAEVDADDADGRARVRGGRSGRRRRGGPKSYRGCVKAPKDAWRVDANKWFRWQGFGVVLDSVRVGLKTWAFTVLPRRGVIATGAAVVCGEVHGVIERVLAPSLWPHASQLHVDVPDFTVADTTTLATTAHTTPEAAAAAAAASVLADSMDVQTSAATGAPRSNRFDRANGEAATAAEVAAAVVRRVLAGLAAAGTPVEMPTAEAAHSPTPSACSGADPADSVSGDPNGHPQRPLHAHASQARGPLRHTATTYPPISQPGAARRQAPAQRREYTVLDPTRAILRWSRTSASSLDGRVGRAFPAGVPCLVHVKVSKAGKGLLSLPPESPPIGSQLFTVPTPRLAAQIAGQRRAVGALLSAAPAAAALLSPRQRRLAAGMAPSTSIGVGAPPSVRALMRLTDMHVRAPSPVAAGAARSRPPSQPREGAAARAGGGGAVGSLLGDLTLLGTIADTAADSAGMMAWGGGACAAPIHASRARSGGPGGASAAAFAEELRGALGTADGASPSGDIGSAGTSGPRGSAAPHQPAGVHAAQPQASREAQTEAPAESAPWEFAFADGLEEDAADAADRAAHAVTEPRGATGARVATHSAPTRALRVSIERLDDVMLEEKVGLRDLAASDASAADWEGDAKAEETRLIRDVSAALSPDLDKVVGWVHQVVTEAALNPQARHAQPHSRLAVVLHCANPGHVEPLRLAVDAIGRRLGAVVSIPHISVGYMSSGTLMRAEVGNGVLLPVFVCDPQRTTTTAIMDPVLPDVAESVGIPLRVFTHVDHVLAALAKMMAIATGHTVLNEAHVPDELAFETASARAALSAATLVDGGAGGTVWGGGGSWIAGDVPAQPFIPTAGARGQRVQPMAKAQTPQARSAVADALAKHILKDAPSRDYGASYPREFTPKDPTREAPWFSQAQ